MRRLPAAFFLLALLAASAFAASVTVTSNYPVRGVRGAFAARLDVAGGRSYTVYVVYVESPVQLRGWVEPGGAGRVRLEPGGWGTVKPGVYRVVLDTAPGYSGEVEVWLEAAGGQPPWLLLVLAAVTAGAAVYQARGRVRDGAWRVAASLVYIIYRPGEALKHETRAAIYEALRRWGGASVKRLARLVGVYQNAVSWHLQVLERFGYVGHARIGRWTVYYYAGHGVEEWLSGFLAAETSWGARVGREELRRLIREKRHLIERLVEARALNSAKLRKILGV